MRKNKNQILRTAVDEFTKKVSKLSSLLEIAIVGSVAGSDPYPNGLNLALIVDNLNKIEFLCSMEELIQNIIYGFEGRNIFFKNMDQLNYVMPLIADVHKCKAWSNRGHTYTEIYKITSRSIPKRFHGPVEVLINIISQSYRE